MNCFKLVKKYLKYFEKFILKCVFFLFKPDAWLFSQEAQVVLPPE